MPCQILLSSFIPLFFFLFVFKFPSSNPLFLSIFSAPLRISFLLGGENGCVCTEKSHQALQQEKQSALGCHDWAAHWDIHWTFSLGTAWTYFLVFLCLSGKQLYFFCPWWVVGRNKIPILFSCWYCHHNFGVRKMKMSQKNSWSWLRSDRDRYLQTSLIRTPCVWGRKLVCKETGCSLPVELGANRWSGA